MLLKARCLTDAAARSVTHTLFLRTVYKYSYLLKLRITFHVCGVDQSALSIRSKTLPDLLYPCFRTHGLTFCRFYFSVLSMSGCCGLSGTLMNEYIHTSVKCVLQTNDSEASDTVLPSESTYTAVPGKPGGPGAPTSPSKPCQHHTSCQSLDEACSE